MLWLMFRRPLCPPCPPPFLQRMVPKGRASSSWTTMHCWGVKRFAVMAEATDRPETFMNVWGKSKMTLWFCMLPSETRPWYFDLEGKSICHLAAKHLCLRAKSTCGRRWLFGSRRDRDHHSDIEKDSTRKRNSWPKRRPRGPLWFQDQERSCKKKKLKKLKPKSWKP